MLQGVRELPPHVTIGKSGQVVFASAGSFGLDVSGKNQAPFLAPFFGGPPFGAVTFAFRNRSSCA